MPSVVFCVRKTSSGDAFRSAAASAVASSWICCLLATTAAVVGPSALSYSSLLVTASITRRGEGPDHPEFR